MNFKRIIFDELNESQNKPKEIFTYFKRNFDISKDKYFLSKVLIHLTRRDFTCCAIR